MECNRDEAIRARDIAEGKFAMHDFLGARKFILKALQLYPPLEGAAQMMAVLDVHIAAQVKVGGSETDWYGILQVEPASDDNLIKKQYRRLALLLHPDKNQARGAEAAFKLIGEAFAVLSDKKKRFLHDSKRDAEPRVAAHAASEPSRPAANAAYHPPSTEPARPAAAYQAQYQAAAAHATPAANGAQAQAQPHSSLTFWTACPLCRMQYQYMRMYLGYQLLCQKCHKPFLASDINAPAGNGTTTFTWNNGPFPTGPVPPAPRRAGFNFQSWQQNGPPANGHARGPSGSAGAPPATAAATTANLVQEAFQRVQRERVAQEKAALKRRTKDNEKLARQLEKEDMRKAREAAKTQEALQKLTKKREEALEREARKKAGLKPTGTTRRRLKRRKREVDDDDEDDEDEEGEELDWSNSGYGSQTDLTRKPSLRHRRNPVAYGIDGEGSDDDDFEEFPGAKKPRPTANGGGLDHVGHDSRIEKGKSVMLDEGDGKGGKNQVPEQLADRFRKEILVRLAEQSRKSSTTKAAGTEAAAKLKQISKASGDTTTTNRVPPHQSYAGNNISSVTNGGRGIVDEKNGDGSVAVPGAGAGAEEGAESQEQQIVVPNPDFHDFDADRTEAHVKKNQIWALYDETDGMPRFYCQINKVVRSPFYVEGIWLEPIHPDKSSFTWLKERELSIGTGEFKLGDEISFETINTFSHLMGSTKRNSRNPKFYEVYPKRPEVWAIYTDYEKPTDTDAEGKPKLRYEFVLIRSDFSTMTGEGRVAKLHKLKDYKTLWTPDAESFQMTVKYDLHKFSHRVPALSVTEKDVQGVPCECLELDPASTSADGVVV